jgi:hypothetical protein
MHPKIHIIFGVIFVLIFHIIFPYVNFFNLSIIFFSSWLIDVDHYFYYIIKKRDLSIIKAYDWYLRGVRKTCHLPLNERKKIYTGFYMFHGIEPLIILFLFGISVSSFFTFIFIGFAFHLILDIPSEIKIKGTFQKISLIYSYSQFRKIKNNFND